MIVEARIALLHLWWFIQRQPECGCCGRRTPTADWYTQLGANYRLCGECRHGVHEWCGCSCVGCNPSAYGVVSAKHTCRRRDR